MSEIERYLYEDHIGRVAEMSALAHANDGLTVPADFLDKVKSDDPDPVFVTVEIESGLSKSNLLWKPEHVKKAVDKVNQQRMGGNLGHPLLDKEKYERDFPKPQVVWVAARLKEAGNKAVGVFKGYVLKSAEAREYLKLGLIDGVSWFGDTTMRPRKEGGFEITNFEPETIDFARKGRSGMPTRVLALAGEMSSGKENGVDPKEIAALSEDELRENNPLLVREIERKVTEPLTEKVGEQTATIEAQKAEVDVTAEIRKLLKLGEGENIIEKIEALLTKLDEATTADVREYIKEVVGKKVKSKTGQAIVHRLLGEMHTDYAGKTLDDSLKKEIEEAVEQRIEADEDVKALVGEMADMRESGGSGEERGGSRVQGRSRVGEMRHEGNVIEGDKETRRGALKVRRVRLGG